MQTRKFSEHSRPVTGSGQCSFVVLLVLCMSAQVCSSQASFMVVLFLCRVTRIILHHFIRFNPFQLAQSPVAAAHSVAASIFSPALATPAAPLPHPVGHRRPFRQLSLSALLKRRRACTCRPRPLSGRSGRSPHGAPARPAGRG